MTPGVLNPGRVSACAMVAILLTALMQVSFATGEDSGGVHSFCGTRHALWSGSAYLRGYDVRKGRPLSVFDVSHLQETLKRNRVSYAYLFAGPFNSDGSLPGYGSSDRARRMVAALKAGNPDTEFLPWVGGLQDRTVFLGDDGWVGTAIRETLRLVDTLGLDGVHLDFEYVLSGAEYVVRTKGLDGARSDPRVYGPNLVRFLKRLRDRRPELFISIVVPATAPDVRGWKLPQDFDQVRQMLRYVDQLAVMFYDTGIHDDLVFRRNMIAQMADLAAWKAGDRTGTELLIGMGTFVNRPELHHYRNLEIESIRNHLATMELALRQMEAGEAVVDGMAIYADWTTDAAEWQQFRRSCGLGP